MNPIKSAYCRTYQTGFRAALPVLPYREPKILPCVEDVAGVLKKAKVPSVLLVTDPGIARLGLADGLVGSLGDEGISCTVFDKTHANPTVADVEEAFSLYRAQGCRAIIGFGGGSSMDCAKGAGIRVARPGTPLSKLRGVLKVHHRLPPLIAVPTTAGTGSEVTLAAVITDGERHYKYAINDFNLIPRYAVHDWRLTQGLPPAITAQTGMDALTHAVEAYIGRSTTARTRRMAEEAVRLVHDNLYSAYEHGDDAVARRNMLTAAYKAGIAFTQSYVGYVHGIAHSLGGRYGIPHGLANAVILPHVLRAYGKAVRPKLARLARISGIAPASADDGIAADAFIFWVDDMNRKMGIPRYIEGIRRADIPVMAGHCDAECNPLYPVPVLWDRAALERMYGVVAGGRFADEDEALREPAGATGREA